MASHLTGRVHDQVQPFLDLQYLYGLARAGLHLDAGRNADALADITEEQRPSTINREWGKRRITVQ